MNECPICHQRTFYYNMRYRVKESMADGNIVIHDSTCLQCKTNIDYRNEIFNILTNYFTEHYEMLMRLRQEHVDNSGRRLTHD